MTKPFTCFFFFVSTEVAHICYNKYCALKQKFAVADEQFTPEKLLENIHYVNVAGVLELIAAIKHLARLFEQNKNVKQHTDVFNSFIAVLFLD